MTTDVNDGSSNSRKRAGWSSRLMKDALFRHRVAKTVWLCAAMFSLGLVSAQRGPAILDLTGSHVQHGSTLFTASAAGNIVGSLLSGVIYDLASKSVLLVGSVVMMGVLTALTPLCSPFPLMAAVVFGVTCFGGSVGTAGNAELVRTWAGKADSALQALHFTFALGALAAPLLTEPFLVPTRHPNVTGHGSGDSDASHYGRHDRNGTDVRTAPPLSTELDVFSNSSLQRTDNDTGTNISMDIDSATTTTWPTPASTANLTLTSNPQEMRVHFAFFISASLSILTALPLVFDYIRNRNRESVSEKESETEAKGKKDKVPREQLELRECKPESEELLEDKGVEEVSSVPDLPSQRLALPLWMYVLALLWASLVFLLHVGVEATFPNYLTTFAVLHLQWSKSRGAVLTSVFWIAFATSRGTGILVVKVLSGARLVLPCLVLLVVSLVTFLLSSLWRWETGVWMGCAVAGAAVSPVFPSYFSWLVQELLPVSGRVTSAALLSANMGAMISPLILGQLMEDHGNMWLPYLMLGEATLNVLTFALLLLFTRFYLQQKYVISDVSKLTTPGKTVPGSEGNSLENGAEV